MTQHGGLLDFVRLTRPGYQANWHHIALCRALDRFASGEIRRLMVLAPPRSGKSELVSRALPAYLLGRNPDARIIATSYAASLATMMSRDVQRTLLEPAYADLFPDTQLPTGRSPYARRADLFEIAGRRGGYRAAGVRGGITGMGFDFGIIDDPIKDRLDANSLTMRERLWEWYTSTFYTRAEPNAGILLTLTPWHEDDLAARLIGLGESDDEADPWTILRFPAIKEDDPTEDDPRNPGEPLWPERFSLKRLNSIRAVIGEFEWNALYQLRPHPPQGALFQREWFQMVS